MIPKSPRPTRLMRPTRPMRPLWRMQPMRPTRPRPMKQTRPTKLTRPLLIWHFTRSQNIPQSSRKWWDILEYSTIYWESRWVEIRSTLAPSKNNASINLRVVDEAACWAGASCWASSKLGIKIKSTINLLRLKNLMLPNNLMSSMLHSCAPSEFEE